jgi:hypothetical protein
LHKLEKDLRRIATECGGRVLPKSASGEALDFADKLLTRLHRLPRANESAAVAYGWEKTASLFFDRVWGVSSLSVPLEDVRFSGRSKVELKRMALLFDRVREQTGRPMTLSEEDQCGGE